jgi:hypothetical protein
MTELKVASDNATIDVGPGNRWVDVYTALSDYGLYCIRGRLKTISVPSLELIRRFHYLINKYSMTIDNVLSYDVVLRNGTRVIANSTSNPDLFWALKGGANNFSIVTKFTIKTLPIPLIVRVSSLLMGQPIVAQALLVLSLLSSQTLLPS